MQLVDQKKRGSREELEPVLYAALVDSMCQNFWPMFIGSVCAAVAAVLTALKTGNGAVAVCGPHHRRSAHSSLSRCANTNGAPAV